MDTYIYELDDGGRPRFLLALVSPDELTDAGLPSEAILGEVTGTDDIGPDNFVVNPAFPPFLESVIARHGPAVPSLIAEARRQENGWVYVTDQRADPSTGTFPEDMLGAFEIREFRLVRFRWTGTHRLLTRRGLFKLPEPFERLLLQDVRALL